MSDPIIGYQLHLPNDMGVNNSFFFQALNDDIVFLAF